MAFPIVPIAAGIGGLNSLKSLFGGGGGGDDFPTPQFFGPQFEELLARRRQATQAQYGNILTDLREYYGNLGLLGNQASLSDAATKASISKGQDIESEAFALQSGEYDRMRQFEISRYLMQLQDQLNEPSFLDQLIQALPGLGQAAGAYFGSKGRSGGVTSNEEDIDPFNDYTRRQR